MYCLHLHLYSRIQIFVDSLSVFCRVDYYRFVLWFYAVLLWYDAIYSCVEQWFHYLSYMSNPGRLVSLTCLVCGKTFICEAGPKGLRFKFLWNQLVTTLSREIWHLILESNGTISVDTKTQLLKSNLFIHKTWLNALKLLFQYWKLWLNTHPWADVLFV